MEAGSGRLDTIAVSIHGAAGVIDLVVPPGAAVSDLAREYADQTTSSVVPVLRTSTGSVLEPALTLRAAGVPTGDGVVATTHGQDPVGSTGAPPEPVTGPVPGPLTATWFWVAGGVAALAGWATGHAPDGDLRRLAVGLLAVSAVVGVLPVGRCARQRVLVAPAFAAAAAFGAVWDPAPERLPLAMGIAGVAAAVAAAVGRSLADGPDEPLRVWMVTGGLLFAVSGLAALTGFGATIVWSVLLAAAVLAARFVPSYAVDVPDHYLIDLDRLAVTAWSAREQPTGRRGRTLVSPEVVSRVAERAARTMAAAAGAIAGVAALCAVPLVSGVDAGFDRIGARALVFFAGATLLLTARSHRLAGVRALLRVGGRACWAALLWQLLGVMGDPQRAGLLGVAIALGLLLVVVAVATGRGWRSVWWSRRAEVAEGFASAAALACLVVSTGLFRTLWELVP